MKTIKSKPCAGNPMVYPDNKETKIYMRGRPFRNYASDYINDDEDELH